MVIQSIVEGYGEVEALPVLLRRFTSETCVYDLDIAVPIRQNSSQLMRVEGIEKAVLIARQTDDVAGILIVFDGDLDVDRGDDQVSCFCPKTDLPALRAAAKAAAHPIPCEIVVAVKEYEAWLLAGITGVADAGKVSAGTTCPADFEESGSPKGKLSRLLSDGPYHERIHQPALSQLFDLRSAHQKSRSFRKLVKTYGELHHAVGSTLSDWPPLDWAP